MTKVIFTTSLDRAGTAMLTSVGEDNQFFDTMFIAVNHISGGSTYSIYANGSITNNGRTFVSAHDAWLEACEMYGANEIFPVKQSLLKKWFGDEYKTKLLEFKEGLSESKRLERESNKLKSKKASPHLWLKSKKTGFWN